MRILIGLLSSLLVMVVLIAIWAVKSVTTSSDSHASSQAAQVSVIDGDTIQLGGAIIQLYGIDAPELGQRCFHDDLWTPCGLNAAFELSKLIRIEHAELVCTSAGTSGHKAGHVCLAGDVDVAHALVIGGYVVIASETTEGYREAETSAQQGSLGLWHSQFVAPAEWRRGKRLHGESGHETDACPVKAVITKDGAHFYYVPTDPAYQSVTVDPSKGERFFCSDEQARQAGWRREGQSPAEATVG